MKKAEDTKEEVIKEVQSEISSEEQKLLEAHRARQKKLYDCTTEINGVLMKYNATLVVNPSSPLNNPRIVVNLK